MNNGNDQVAEASVTTAASGQYAFQFSGIDKADLAAKCVAAETFYKAPGEALATVQQ